MMKLFIFLLLVELLSFPVGNAQRILGGSQAEYGEFPALAQLWHSGQYIRCLGSLVSTKWVVTSAICCDPW